MRGYFQKLAIIIIPLLTISCGKINNPHFVSARVNNDNSLVKIQTAMLPVSYPIAGSIFRQSSSNCARAKVTKLDSCAPVKGSFSVIKNQLNNTLFLQVNLQNATPGTKYNLFLKRKQKIGDLHTDETGIGTAVFNVPLNTVPSDFAFDMYPNGTAGTKYHSTQVQIN